MAEGPMSTPRRPAPRSSGAPMIAMCECLMLGPGPVKHSRIRNGFPDMFQSTHPSYETFDSHTETGVRDSAVFPKIDVPVEGFRRKLVLFQPLQQQIQI